MCGLAGLHLDSPEATPDRDLLQRINLACWLHERLPILEDSEVRMALWMLNVTEK